MATVYSLVCFGGLSGKAVTFTDAGDVVNLSNHGLRQGVTGVVFSTTGSLPTGIAAGTTYYPRDDADASKFTIYATKADALAGTNQVTFSGTGSGTHTVKSAYMLGLTSEQLARYGSAGSERIYGGIIAWNTARGTETNAFDDEVCELGEEFSEATTTDLNIALPCSSALIVTKVNGIRTSAWHQGLIGKGFIFSRRANSSTTAYIVSMYRCTSDGFTVAITGTGYTNNGIALSSPNSIALNMIAIGRPDILTGLGIGINSPGAAAINCISVYWGLGLRFSQYTYNLMACHCLATKNTTGFSGTATTNIRGFLYNNVSIANVTNWAVMTGIEGASGNFGLDTDDIPVTGSGTVGVIDETDFQDFSSNLFYPSASSSPQVDSGSPFYGRPSIDIADQARPNYDPTGSEAWDCGPFEFDHGNGLAPSQVTLAISGMAEGSVLAVYKNSDDSEIISPTAIGASGNYSTELSYTGDVQITVKVRKGTSTVKYLPYEAPGLITDTGFGLIVNQVEDAIAI